MSYQLVYQIIVATNIYPKKKIYFFNTKLSDTHEKPATQHNLICVIYCFFVSFWIEITKAVFVISCIRF